MALIFNRYDFENLCYFCRELLSGKASLKARALPSHTRDLFDHAPPSEAMKPKQMPMQGLTPEKLIGA
jgi:hypothetical protein